MNTEKKNCGQCLIYSPDMLGPGCNGCPLHEYEGEVRPDAPACGRFISRQEFLDHISHDENGKYIITPSARDDNSEKAPVLRYWAKNHDYVTGGFIGYLPYCPSCNSLTFGKDECEYCRQPFIQDQAAVEFFRPEPVRIKQCPYCKAKEAFHYIRQNNGKTESGYCTVCGVSVLDRPRKIQKLAASNPKLSHGKT